MLSVIGIIPARFASSRLLGKPLADIGGKSMIQHTYESASKAKLISRVIVAVDDHRVYQTVKKFGGEVIMTPGDITTGSDRIAYVSSKLSSSDIIVNIQGDEPFINGQMIDQAIEPLLFDKSIEVSTLAKKISSVSELKSNSVVKVVFDASNFALYFSRTPIPFVRDASNFLERFQSADFYKHIGLYVFRTKILQHFTTLQPTYLEQIEKLEQLRMLENGIRIKIVETEFESLSVDTPEDLERARNFYKKMKSVK
jgi:3-deoxy-manno-octulosonate cytidylyltransferase (CMP-KDO synthetase)